MQVLCFTDMHIKKDVYWIFYIFAGKMMHSQMNKQTEKYRCISLQINSMRRA